MRIVPVVSVDDPRLARFRVVRDAELLRGHGLFVAEGRLVVERVLRDRRFQVVEMLVSQAAFAALGQAFDAQPPDCDVFLLESPRAFEGLTGFNVHRGCLALIRRPDPLDWRALVLGDGVSIALEGLTDADNVGSIFRNAAAFGARAVLLSPTCCDPLYRKAVRTSMAAVTRIPFARMDPWVESLRTLKSLGVTLVALSPRESATALDVFAARPLPGRMALVVGSEGAGLSEDAEQAADCRVRIPIRHDVDSLNVAVAVGIALARVVETRKD